MKTKAANGARRWTNTRRMRNNWGSAILAAAVAFPFAAFADDAPPTITSSLPQLASVDAFKKQLADKGVGVQLNYIGEILGNVSGGQQQGGIYDGRLELVIDADLEKLLGWKGGAFHTNGYWIQGTGLSRYYIGNLMTVSNIEALPTVRLYELWYEQKFFDDKVAFRFGQLAADTEFVTSKYASLFVNGTFGWPTINAVEERDGPAYPLATPGVRLKLGGDSDPFNVLMALYNGDPAGPGVGDPQRRDPYGVNFTLEGPPLAIEEIQYRFNQEKDAPGLAGTLKLGTLHHFGDFNDLRYDVGGLPIGLTGNQAGTLLGNWAVYGVWDQQIYKLGGDPSKGVGFFVRAVGAPQDRNLIDFYIDGGFNFAGFVPNRPDDVIGVAGAYGKISNALRGYQHDAGITPVQDYEALIEVTYQAALMPGWTLQPDFQYIIHPGGNIADASGQVAKNAVVIGLRTSLSF
jgi:porin